MGSKRECPYGSSDCFTSEEEEALDPFLNDCMKQICCSLNSLQEATDRLNGCKRILELREINSQTMERQRQELVSQENSLKELFVSYSGAYKRVKYFTESRKKRNSSSAERIDSMINELKAIQSRMLEINYRLRYVLYQNDLLMVNFIDFGKGSVL